MERGINMDAILKGLDKPDEVCVFDKGRFEIIHIRGLAIGRATYEPGWRWSKDVGLTVPTPQDLAWETTINRHEID